MKKDLSPKRYYTAVALYCAFSLGLIAFYAIRRDSYHLDVSAMSLLMPLIIEAYNWLLPIRRTWLIDVIVLGFIFLSHPLGVCVDLYATLPWYDKLCHMFSGTLMSLLCLAFYYLLKPNRRVEKEDAHLAAAFMFLGSMAIAGLWEIAEYIAAPIMHRDLQHVATTGVGDSMQDMIVCLIGTVIALPAALRMCGGRGGWLTAPVEVFLQNNGVQCGGGRSDGKRPRKGD